MIKLSDIQVLVHLLTVGREITTTELAKEIFSPKNRRELVKFDSYIRRWFERFEKYGVIIKEKVDGKTHYKVNFERVRVGKALVFDEIKQETIEIVTLGIKLNGFGWVFFELPFDIEVKDVKQPV